MKTCYHFITLTTVLLCVLGCGPKAPYEVVPIEGTATWNDKPIPEQFKLKFRPHNGMSESTGFIKDDGKFTTIHTVDIDGVPTGKCTVHVLWNGGQGTFPPNEFKPLLGKYGFGTEGLPLEITKKDTKMKLNFE